ncbi:MAG: SufD family Fe-S cluster assembly protein [Lachnospiraceae bacterium]|nr:SufD family Fe-S cluster assembly protein [Lachnospiraceae bacterium]
MHIEKRVNHLPVLTWNRLDFNEAVFSADVDFDGKQYIKETALPEGITQTAELSREAFAAWCRAHGCVARQEAVVAGKFPMYAQETFQTGMGAETDELLAEAGAKIRLYEVAEGVKLAQPLRFESIYPQGAATVDAVLLHAKKGSEVTLIQYFTTDANGDAEQGFVGTSTRVYLEEGAKVHLVKVQMLPKGFVFFDDMGAKTEKNAELTYTQLELGAAKAYLGACVDQTGEQSVLRADLGYVGMPGSFLDFNYVDTFRGKKTQGVMRFNGVLFENAQKVSRETLDFRQYCTDADGDEEEDILVLGDDIVNKANPMILGEEEKVSGRHAVTIGKLSPEMLFYMQSRGMDEMTAQELMVRARIQEVANRIPDEEIRRAAGFYVDRIFCDRENCHGMCRI